MGALAAESPNALISRVSVTASQLGPTLQKVFCTAQFGLGQAEASIFSDEGKLKTAASSAAFQIDQTTLNTITPTLNLGAERCIYSHLLGAIYQPYTLLQSDLDTYDYHHQVRTPLTFACNVLDSAFYPWKKAPRSTWIQLNPRDPTYPGTLDGPIGMALSTPFHYDFIHAADYVHTPPASVMATLTEPIAKGGGLGMSLFDLFFHHFKRSAVLCGERFARQRPQPDLRAVGPQLALITRWGAQLSARMARAGTPATSVASGTSRLTTAPAATTA